MADHASSLPGPLGLEAGGQRENLLCFHELKQWMDSKLYEKGSTLEIIICHSLMVWGLMVMVHVLALLDCADTLTGYNKFYTDAIDGILFRIQ